MRLDQGALSCVLVNGQGWVRGYDDSDDEKLVDQVVRVVGLLVNRGS